ncbi:MAG: hypothetical protein AVDCRST_MAG91-1007 [uncultured Sphingomonadaceae bacterium]|uniref:Uncharacterized protein n=1 Tax=uncultured Sphingomonadaceae bacterium TaxID=169976 RepID=A0A6J4SPF9_9SPHN|nr:MAG: hypothetical protein AVDCRST_MAG91-1007 [uncultured Sphingomonadaceae bacterium]
MLRSPVAISIHHLDISAALFRLATEAVQRRSIELGAFASIHDVVSHATERTVAAHVDRDQIEHALAIGIDGPIRISLIARASWRPMLREVQQRLSETAGRRLSIKQTVAVLLQQP